MRNRGHARHYGRRRSERLFSGIFLRLILLALLGGGILSFFLIERFHAKGPLLEDRLILIESGQGISAIAEHLQAEGIISDSTLFIAGALLHYGVGNLQAGEYLFSAGMSMRESADMLSSGRVFLRKLTIPEGWTSWQIKRYLEENTYLEGTLPEEIEEGSLRPDTYFYKRGEQRLRLLNHMRLSQNTLLKELWEGRADNLPLTSPPEALILASIVEKETGIAGERRKIAGVFINRLRRKMRLQSDPTIIYGITNGKKALGRAITKADITGETPYNTYRINGLPPAPIANPGRAAIAAVLNPEKTDALYFVADGSGGHVFSKTLAEHNKHVRNWRKIERKKRAEEADKRNK